jgi:hypothetical protein
MSTQVSHCGDHNAADSGKLHESGIRSLFFETSFAGKLLYTITVTNCDQKNLFFTKTVKNVT